MSTLAKATILAMLAWLGAASATAGAAESKRETHAPIIVFMTDYGTLDDSVAICKGVMLSIAPDATIIDLTHQVTAYSVADGARYLARAALYYPVNTIFVGVVDPGVGTARRSIIARSKRGHYFVVPDNGLLTLIEDRDGIESAREITNPAWMLPGPHSATFHGRDIFAPAAGHLARGDDWSTAGPQLQKLTRLTLSSATLDAGGIDGHVVALDGPFGNLITDIKASRFRELGYRVGDTVSIKVGDKTLAIPYVNTFGDVPTGQPLLYIDSSELLSVAINQGNFAQAHGVVPPVPLFVAKRSDSKR
ncbi:MAG: SAM-dependent chlorinase/fluorinase [Gammaproteobacteria bacterium]